MLASSLLLQTYKESSIGTRNTSERTSSPVLSQLHHRPFEVIPCVSSADRDVTADVLWARLSRSTHERRGRDDGGQSKRGHH